MMGRQSGQLSMMVMDLSELISNNHLLRRISQVISFDFIYEILEPYYPLHTPLQESSKTADDGASAPREWCGCSGCMVHSGRRHGAHGRRAFPLFGNTFALAHGFTLDLDGVGVVDDPVTDGVGQGGVVQVLVPLAGVVLGAEDGGGHLAPGLY